MGNVAFNNIITRRKGEHLRRLFDNLKNKVQEVTDFNLKNLF